MKKTLRLFALLGIVAASWLATERPTEALVNCNQMHGSACISPTPPVGCYNTRAQEPFLCHCLSNQWDCEPY